MLFVSSQCCISFLPMILNSCLAAFTVKWITDDCYQIDFMPDLESTRVNPVAFFANQDGDQRPSWKKSNSRFGKEQTRNSFDAPFFGKFGGADPIYDATLNFYLYLDNIFIMATQRRESVWSIKYINKIIWNEMHKAEFFRTIAWECLEFKSPPVYPGTFC